MPETYSELARRLWPYLRPLLDDVLATVAQGLKLTNSTPESIVPSNGRVGTATSAARADHRHPWDGNATSLGGVAASAYALKSDLLGVGNTGARLDPNLVLATPATTKGTTSLRALVLTDLPDIDLDDLADVNTSGVATGDVLRKSAGDWTAHTPVVSDNSDVNTSGVATGDILRYDGTWGPDTLELGELNNVTTTSAAAGDGIVFDGTDWEITPLANRNLLHNATIGVATGLYDPGGATVSRTDTYPFPAARWRVRLPPSSSVTYNQETANLPSGVLTYAGIKLTGTTGLTRVDLRQYFGSVDTKNLFKRNMTFSLYVYNDTGAAITPTLFIITPNAADDYTTNNARLTQSLQSCADGVWTRVSHTFDPSAYTDIDNGMGIVVRFTNVDAATKSVSATAAQLEPGSVATPFQARDLALEIPIIQRYFVSLPQSGGTTGYVGNGTGISTTAAKIGVPLPQNMRTAPAVTGTASNFQLTDGVSTTTLTGIVVDSASSLYCVLEAQVASGLTQYRPYFLQQANGSANLFFIAEY